MPYRRFSPDDYELEVRARLSVVKEVLALVEERCLAMLADGGTKDDARKAAEGCDMLARRTEALRRAVSADYCDKYSDHPYTYVIDDTEG